MIQWILPAILLISFPPGLGAQVEGRSLLVPTRSSSQELNDLDSGRYKVRRSQNLPKTAKPVAQRSAATAGQEEAIPKKDETPQGSPSVSPPLSRSGGGESRGVVEQVRELVLGTEPERTDESRNQWDQEDLRLNRVELTFAPTYIYNDSDSNYWYRKYNTAGPGVFLEAKTWFTPLIAFHGSYLTSLSTEIRSSSDGSKHSRANHVFYQAGVHSRRFFGSNSRSPALTFGLDYSEYNLELPPDEPNRVEFATKGLRISAEMMLFQTRQFSRFFGVEIVPRAKQTEKKSLSGVKSGGSNETDRVGLWLGGRTSFNRRQGFYWKISHSAENTVFNGQANTPDPVTGIKPSGVGVRNSISVLEIGVIWGN